MITWAINHNSQIGVAVIAFVAGVVFAAWRQHRLEAAEDKAWERALRADPVRLALFTGKPTKPENVVTFPTATAKLPARWPDGFPFDDNSLM